MVRWMHPVLWIAIGTLGLGLLSQEVGAQTPPSVPSPPTPYLVVPRTGQAPTVDGNLSERVWDRAARFTPFTLLGAEVRAATETAVYALYDDTALYLAFSCDEPEAKEVKPQAREHDDPALYSDDSIEIFLDPEGHTSGYYHLVINPAGSLLDERGRDPSAWNPGGVVAKASLGVRSWTAEILLPWNAVGGPPKEGARWGVNFCRTRPRSSEFSSWAPLRYGFRDPTRFAEIGFGESPLLVDVVELGDAWGELRGGGTVKLRLRSVAARGVVPAVKVASVSGTQIYRLAQRVVQVQGLSEQRVEVPYAVDDPRFPRAQVGILDAASNETLFLSPEWPLRDTWLRPRIDELKRNLDSCIAYVLGQPGTDPAHRLDADLSAQRAALAEIEASRTASQWGSVPLWKSLDQKLVGIRNAISQLTLVTSLFKSRTAEEIASGTIPRYLVAGWMFMEAAQPGSVVPLEDVKPRVWIFGSPGEYEPASILVTAAEDLKDVSVAVGNLTSQTGQVIPSQNIEAWVVKQWEQGGLSPLQEPGQRYLVPELLVKDDRPELRGPRPDVRLTGTPVTDIRQGQSKQFWLTVRIPGDANEGLYVGPLTVTPSNQPARTIELQVKVLKIRLNDPIQKYLIYYRQTLRGSGADAIGPDAARMDLADMKRHGIDQAMIYDAPADLMAALDLRQSAGLTGPVPYALWQVPAPERGEFVRTLARLKRTAGGPEIWFYAADQPVTPERIAEAAATAAAVRDAGGKTVVALDRATMVGRGGELCDIPNYTVQTPEFRDYVATLATGGLPPPPGPQFYYWPSSLENPVVNRLLAGFYLVKSRLGGVFPYAYQDALGQDPFAEAAAEQAAGAGRFRPQMTTYPSANGPIDTLQWEAFREGRDDVRYWLSLIALVAEGQGYRANPEVAARLAEAEQTLNFIQGSVQSDWKLSLQTLIPRWFQEQRWELALRILRLQEALAAQPALPTVAVPPITPALVAPISPAPAPRPAETEGGLPSVPPVGPGG